MVTIPPTTANTVGAVLVGSLVAACLYGVTTLQTYIYFACSHGDSDSVFLRSLVAFLWILDTVHTIFVSHAVYTYAMGAAKFVTASDKPVWSMIAQVVVMAVSDAIIRGIFCYRIRIMSNRNRLAYGVNALLSIVLFCQMILLCISAFPSYSGPSVSFPTLFYANMATGVLADAAIAATMTWIFLRSKSTLNFRRTNHVLHTLISCTLRTGALATLCPLGSLISYAIAPNTSIFLAFITNMSKLLLNSLFASLNSRRTLREEMAAASAGARGDVLSIPGSQ